MPQTGQIMNAKRQRQSLSRAAPGAGIGNSDIGLGQMPKSGWVSERITLDDQGRQLELPPSRIVYPLVDTFLGSVNCVLPLYDDAVLLEAVRLWYSMPSCRTRTTWASINVVMALAHCCDQGLSEQSELFVAESVGKAQSVLTDLIMGDLRLDSLQVILGLVLSFQRMPNMRPAAVLISTAFRLIHEMGIHRREGYEGISNAEALQRRRVFWVAYILDRDISMRTRQPPVHQDANIDLDLPPPVYSSTDRAGFVDAGDGRTHFNVFRSRAQLARIQGQVHECIFSVQGRSRPAGEASLEIARLRGLLVRWRAQIPATLGAEALMRTRGGTVLPKALCTLYATSLSLLGQLTRVNAIEFDWVNRLLRHARNVRAGLPSVPPASLEGWDALVEESRSFVMLFLSIPQKHIAFGRLYCCSLISGLMFLSANCIGKSDQAHYESDQQLRLQAKGFIDEFSQLSRHDGILAAQKAYAELDWHVLDVSRMEHVTIQSLGYGI
ncbi:putative transcriptional regulatory protein [Colletotrichum tanaceti]|nr:putative transcriptional regulatory protein [Colletotrichum tanaceti]